MSRLGLPHTASNRACRGVPFIVQFAYANRAAVPRWIDAPGAMLAETLAPAWAKGRAGRHQGDLT